MTSIPYAGDSEAREQIVRTGREMASQGFVVANEGNLSVRTSPDTAWLTPSGAAKGKLEEAMLIKMDLEGNVLVGNRAPSSETRLHLRVYQENPDLRAVVHCHPVYATSMGIAGIPLDAPIMAEPMLMIGPVPVARYATPGSADLAASVAPFCREYNGALMSNHGAIAWGRNMEEAFYRMEVMETYAKLMLISRLLGQCRPLSEGQMQELYDFKVSRDFGETMLPRGASAATNMTDVLPAR